MMKVLTVPLLVCTMMALAQVSSVPATVPDYSSIPFTEAPPVPEDPYGGWFPSCPDGWSMHSQQCLLFVPTYMTWAEAQRNCQSRGGQLASVYSTSQAEEIHKEVQRAGRGYGQFWVGGHNSPANPSWSWSDYMGVSAFADFCRGRDAKHEHHCLQITFGEGKAGCLDDRKCETKLPSVCGSLIM